MWTIATLLASILLCVGFAHAGVVEDCNQVRDLNRQLRGCSAYIKQGKGTPENIATAYLNRANIYARRGQHALALADYASAISRDPQNPLAPYNRGNAYFDLRQYELAIADYTRAIALDAGFALAYLNRGIAHEQLGDTSAAVADYKHTLAIDAEHETAKRRLQRVQSQ
jgi:tetratricopeptide (TPR) repeat protein